jgi:acyl-CoA thioesterase
MTESVFQLDGEHFTPTQHARGPWDERALHGGAPAALIAGAFERMEPGSELLIARLGFEFLRPIPFSALTLSTRLARAGRRVQELAAELRAGEELICRASALRVRAVPADLPGAVPPPGEPPAEPASERLPGPELGRAVRFALEDASRPSFGASAMEMRWLTDPFTAGPGRVWMRLRHPLLPGEQPSALAHLAAAADFGNGVSALLPFDRFLFINADLSIHLHRPPRGDWIGLDARTMLHSGGTGLAESVLHDEHGPVGRAFQTLVVQAR